MIKPLHYKNVLWSHNKCWKCVQLILCLFKYHSDWVVLYMFHSLHDPSWLWNCSVDFLLWSCYKFTLKLITSTGWSVGTDIFLLFITQALRIFEISSYTHKFAHMFPFWYLAFKITRKTFFIKIEVFGKKCWIFNYRWKCQGKSYKNTGLILFLLSFLGILSWSPHIFQGEG